MAENRIQNSLTNRAPGISPQASLLRISAAATPPPNGNSFYDLAGALDTINPQIGHFLAARDERGKTDAEKKADLEAVRLASEGQLKVTNDQLLEYVNKGDIKKAHLPVFQDRLRFRLGATMAAGLRSDLYEQMKSTTSAEGRVDPTALSNKAIADGLDQFPEDDVQGRTGYLRAAQDIQARFVSDSETLYTQNYTEHGEALQAEELSTVMARMADGEDVSADLQKWDSVFVEEGGTITDRRRFYEAAAKTTIERLMVDNRFDEAIDFVDQLYSINLAKGVPLVTKAMDAYLFKVADTIEQGAFQAQFEDQKQALALDESERNAGRLEAIKALSDSPGKNKLELMALASGMSGTKKRSFEDTITTEIRVQSDQETQSALLAEITSGNFEGSLDRIDAAEQAKLLSPADAVDLTRRYNSVQTALFTLKESVGTALRFSKTDSNGLLVAGGEADWVNFELPNPDRSSSQTTLPASEWMAREFNLGDQTAVSDGFNEWVNKELMVEAAAIADQLGNESFDAKAVKDSIYKKLAARAPAKTKELIAQQVRVVTDRKQRVAAQQLHEKRMEALGAPVQIDEFAQELKRPAPEYVPTSQYADPGMEAAARADAKLKDVAIAIGEALYYSPTRPASDKIKRLQRRYDKALEGSQLKIDLFNKIEALKQSENNPEVFTPGQIADVHMELIKSVYEEGASAKEILKGETKDGIILNGKDLPLTFPVFTREELVKETKDGWSEVFLSLNEEMNPGGNPMDLYIAQLANPRKEIDAK